MITEADIAHWQRRVPWPTLEQVEQDLVLSRLIVEIARDLFDLWLAVQQAGASPAEIAACFGLYRPDGWTAARAVVNLEAKLEDPEFTADVERLVSDWPDGYTVEAAGLLARAVLGEIDRHG